MDTARICSSSRELLKTGINRAIKDAFDSRFSIQTGRMQILFDPNNQDGPWIAVLPFRAFKSGGKLVAIDFSEDVKRFALGDLYNNTGFSEAISVAGKQTFWGTKEV